MKAFKKISIEIKQEPAIKINEKVELYEEVEAENKELKHEIDKIQKKPTTLLNYFEYIKRKTNKLVSLLMFYHCNLE